MKLKENAVLGHGKYHLISPIGRGGQAEVWEAEQTGLDGFSRRVVLKCLFRGGEDHERQRKSLLQEARLVAQLKHPNIVEIYEVGEEENLVYIVMERIDGKDLEWLLNRCYRCFEQPLPWGLVASLGIEICKALYYAHQFKAADGHWSPVIHRDIKPSNVLLSRSGFVKVIDFGIAKSKRLQKESDPKTLQGHIKGTPAYMSPEQLMNRNLDHRSDLFSLGSLLYELATGELPFPGEDVMQIAVSVVSTEPKPMDLVNPEIPREFDLLIRGLLSKDPEQRPPQARALQKELEMLLRRKEIYIDQEKIMRFYEGLLQTIPGTGEHMTFNPLLPSNPSLPALAVAPDFLSSMAKAQTSPTDQRLQEIFSSAEHHTPRPVLGERSPRDNHDTEERLPSLPFQPTGLAGLPSRANVQVPLQKPKVHSRWDAFSARFLRHLDQFFWYWIAFLVTLTASFFFLLR